MLPQDAALMQRSTSLSLPGLRCKQNMHKKGPDGGCMTFEDCVTRTLIHYKKLTRLDLTFITQDGLEVSGMQRHCDSR